MADDHLPHWATGPDTAKVAAIEERVRGWRTAFPHLRIEPHELLVDGDPIAARWVATGTQQGDDQGQAPTGHPVEWHGTNVVRIGCGRITEIWSEMDIHDLLRQLGHPSAVGAPAAATPAPESGADGPRRTGPSRSRPAARRGSPEPGDDARPPTRPPSTHRPPNAHGRPRLPPTTAGHPRSPRQGWRPRTPRGEIRAPASPRHTVAAPPFTVHPRPTTTPRAPSVGFVP